MSYYNHEQPWRRLSSVVRKWKLSFDGSDKQSIKLFLMELDEKRRLSDISDSEILNCLPFVFTGMALLWCRLYKWETWEQFYADALRCYGGQVYNNKLRYEEDARTQGPNEPVVTYISKLGTLMRLQDPEPSDDEIMYRLYRNMHPSLKVYLRFSEITSIETFYLRAIEAERMLEKESIKISSRSRELEDLLSSKLKIQEARAQLPEEMEEIIATMIEEKLANCGVLTKTVGKNPSTSAVRKNEKKRDPKSVNAKRGA